MLIVLSFQILPLTTDPDSFTICSQILPVASDKAGSYSHHERLSACKLLAKLSGKTELAQEIVDTLRCLCQDVSADVRAAACRLLPTIARGEFWVIFS